MLFKKIQVQFVEIICNKFKVSKLENRYYATWQHCHLFFI